MSDLDGEMEREIIHDHYAHPRHYGSLGEGARLLENPSCGDKISLELRPAPQGGEVVELRFEGKGCSISQASASMMTELLSGKTAEESLATAKEVLEALRGERPPESLEAHGDVASLAGVAKLPVRVKCATLAWQGAIRSLEAFVALPHPGATR